MELCSDNLMNIINQKQIFFRRQESEAMNSIEYFISCEIFKEILECVQYLHEHNMMHGNIKPENILFNNISKNYRFVKLWDFDLLDERDYILRSDPSDHENQEIIKYMAPEVRRRKKYSTKCDIYSLGELTIKLFQIDIFE